MSLIDEEIIKEINSKICSSINSKKTHCKNGHLLPKKVKGLRICKICRNVVVKRSYEKQLKNKGKLWFES